MTDASEVKDRASRGAIAHELQRTTCVESPSEPGMFRVANQDEAETMAAVAVEVLRKRGALR